MIDRITASQIACDAHNKAMGLEEDNGIGVDAWHLLISLREACEAAGFDFDEIIEEAKEEIWND